MSIYDEILLDDEKRQAKLACLSTFSDWLSSEAIKSGTPPTESELDLTSRRIRGGKVRVIDLATQTVTGILLTTLDRDLAEACREELINRYLDSF